MNVFQRVIYVLFGLHKKSRKTFINDFQEDIEESIIKDYKNGKKWIDIKKAYDISSQRINIILNKNHIHKRNKKRKKP